MNQKPLYELLQNLVCCPNKVEADLIIKEVQERFDAIEKERDELKAHCNELLDFVERVKSTYQFEYGMTIENVFGITAKLLVEKTPQQSLAEVEARAIDRFIANITEKFPQACARTLISEAKLYTSNLRN